MKTKVYDQKDDNLKELAEILKAGGLVALPTETVYGLAADGLNPEAVKKIFTAKKRPMDNPLILHISEIKQIYDLVEDLDQTYAEILSKLWPGPLTVILKKSSIIPDEVSAGLETVAIRMPDKKLTQELISLVGSPLAAPSANISGRPSPTSAKAVLADMDGRIEAILDGGDSKIGIESTVLDLSVSPVKILRPGYYTQEILEKYFGQVDLDLALRDKDQTPKSPGQKYKHYSPRAKVVVFMGDDEKVVNEMKKISQDKENIGIMVFEDQVHNFPEDEKVISMGSKNDLSEMAHILFESFRKMDEKKVETILVQGVEEKGFGLSVMNRLKKAAGNNIKYII